jgi:hypothetical protein
VVGGFGRNALVQAELKGQFRDKVVFTNEDGEVAVKNGACLMGIRRAQDEANPDPTDQDDQDDNKKEAKASFGYCLDRESAKIEWFIVKGDGVSNTKKEPSFFPFPPEEAFTDDPVPTMVIYKTPYRMEEPVDYPVGDKKVEAFRMIKCKNREVLENGSPRKLAVYIYGIANIHFEVFIADRPFHFIVSGRLSSGEGHALLLVGIN